MRSSLSLALLFFCSVAHADTLLPDTDDSPTNNTLATAQDLGHLSLPDGNTPNDIDHSARLGVVLPGKFDSRDVYRVTLRANEWNVRFHLAELPLTTMWISVHAADGRVLNHSIGADEEDFTMSLGAGSYFVVVYADPAVAKGRELSYTLSFRPQLIPRQDNAGASCASAPMLNGYQRSHVLSGSLDPSNPRDFYGIFLAGDSEPTVTRVGRHFGVAMIDGFSGKTFSLQDGQVDRWIGKIDPGYYCLSVQDSMAPGVANYQTIFGTGTSSVRPSGTKAAATDLNYFDLGNLSENGRYGTHRYVNWTDAGAPINPDRALRLSREYTIREWLNAGESHWFDFTTVENLEVQLTVGRLHASVRATIEDEQGNVLGTSSTNATSLLPGRLPAQRYSGFLPSGHYYVRVELIGGTMIGTPYSLRFRGSPGSPAPLDGL